MKKNRLIYTILIVTLFMSGCSTQKNTGSSRAFHNLTSRYNILFNGTESYKSGMLSLQSSFKDDYNELLPVFLYHDPEQLSGISSDMDRSIKKATKVISLHSIKAKPEIEEGKEMTEAEREFYSKFEYNKWVDDSYLLMGKAYFYQNDLEKAGETFSYLQTNFAKEPSIAETKIWLARLALEKGRIKEAEEYLKAIDGDRGELSKDIIFEYNATLAHKSVIEEDYQKAITCLRKAIDNTNKKYYKQRYTFIIAQLYQKLGEVGNASKNYLAVVKMNPPYEMTFNAQINMALTYDSGKGMREIERQLQKMLKDDKNIDYQDQIYYAWGNLYYKAGNINTAIEYYLKSASSSKGNISQQARTFLTIADIYYDKPEYVSAQMYYDSTVTVIDANFPNYPVIYAKSISLTNLVTQINTVQLQDSVQKLRDMPEAEMYAFIDNIIEDVQRADEEQKLREQEAAEQSNASVRQTFDLNNASGSSWYFYNATSLSLGRQEFKRSWGNRKLEDNWRRKNKNTVTFDVGGAEGGEIADEGITSEQRKAAVGKYSREYYLVDIPFTDSALTASHEKIKAALFEMGGIYSSELKDYDKAIESYQDLLSRYPNYSDKLMVYYKLYSIGVETGNKSMEANYKQRIISEYPQSNYAKVLSDPEYFKKIEAEERKFHDKYIQTFKLFENSDFAQVTYLSEEAIKEKPDHKLVPQFEYMLTISKGVSKDTAAFIGDLQKLVANYPGSDIAENSKLLIEYLGNDNPESAVEQRVKKAVALYKVNMEEEHLVMISVSKTKFSNQMMFNIINFNLDNYEEDNLKVKKYDLNGTALLNVTKFMNGEVAAKYLEGLNKYDKLWHDVEKNGSQVFLISRSNYEILKKESDLEQYLLFYKKQY